MISAVLSSGHPSCSFVAVDAARPVARDKQGQIQSHLYVPGGPSFQASSGSGDEVSYRRSSLGVADLSLLGELVAAK